MPRGRTVAAPVAGDGASRNNAKVKPRHRDIRRATVQVDGAVHEPHSETNMRLTDSRAAWLCLALAVPLGFAPAAHALTATIQAQPQGATTWTDTAITVTVGTTVQFRTTFTGTDCPALGHGRNADPNERDTFTSNPTVAFDTTQPQTYSYFGGDQAPCTNGGPSPNSPSATFGTAGDYTITYTFDVCASFDTYFCDRFNNWNTYTTATFTVHVVAQTPCAAGAGDGLTGDYWNLPAADYPSPNYLPPDPSPTPDLSRTDATIDFNWGAGSPGTGIGTDHFIVKWHGWIQTLCAGTYNFQTTSDDGIRVKITVNGTQQTVIDNWTDHAATVNTGSITFPDAETQYPIEVDYYEDAGVAQANLSWEPVTVSGGSPASSYSTVPQTQLYTAQPTPPSAQALYHMDAAAWNGTNGEVIDSSGNGRNGTAGGGAQTAGANPAVPGNPGTCRYGTFNGTTSYVDVNGLSSLLDGTASLAFWIKTTQTGTAEDWSSPGVAGYEATGATDDIFWGWIDQNGHIGMSTGNEYGNVSTVPINDGQWHFVVLTRDATAGTYQIFIDGQLNTSGTTAAGTIPQTFSSIGRIENEPNSTGNPTSGFFAGDLDEVSIYSGVLTLSQVQNLMNQTHPCTGAVTLSIAANPNASTCTPDPVTITAYNSDGSIDSNYTDTVTLGSSSGHGDWSLVSGATYGGSFAPGAADSGTAQYQFGAGDGGQIVLDFSDVHADDLTLTGLDTTGRSAASALISFRDDAFVFNPLNALGDDPDCPGALCGYVAAAGRPQQFQVTAVRRDTNGVCATLTGYTGNIPLEAWITRTAQDPNGSAPSAGGAALPNAQPAGNNLTLAFSNGEATLSLDTSDVGQYYLNLSDVSSGFAKDQNGNPRPITGGSTQYVTVRPFAFAFSGIQAGATSNPGATTPAGGVFAKAGAPFGTTVTAVDWISGDPANGVPAGPVAAATHPPTPSFAANVALGVTAPSTPAAGIGGTLGALSGGAIAAAGFGGGSASATGLGYSEVGSVTLDATASDYLGLSGLTVAGTSAPVGRFTPDHFATTVNTPKFKTFCPVAGSASGGFTYMGQPFKYAAQPVISVTAKSASGSTTQNYWDFTGAGGSDWFRLTNASLASATPHDQYSDEGGQALDTAGLTTGGANPTVAITGHGTGTITFSAGSGIDYVRSSTTMTAPFAARIDLQQSVTDLDTVQAATNPVTITDIGWDAGNAIRYGRLALRNAYGSELLDLGVPLSVEYYAGADTGFVTNGDDDCTTGLKVTLGPYTGSLSGHTAVKTFTQPAAAGTFALVLAAPGAGNTGGVTVSAGPVSAGDLSWLTYQWSPAPAARTFPSALAVFGIYKGSDKTVFTHRVAGGG